MSLFQLSVSEMRSKLDNKEVSVKELLDAHFEQIKNTDSKLKAFLTLNEEGAYQSAESAQKKINEGESEPLTGIPYALKDNIVTKGIRTTCASKILHNWVPQYNSTAYERLSKQGAILLGKTNLDEFAMGSSTEFSAFHPTHNPWDLERVPGGSSGGSAVAVSSGMAPLSYGSDTGGSVRQPASLCGVVGFKPTYGRVSRYGLVAFSSSLDQIGPFARNVEDVILGFEAIYGRDSHDSTTVAMPFDGKKARERKIKGRKIAYPKEFVTDAFEGGVRDLFFKTLELLANAGAEIKEISLPMIEQGVSTYYIIAPAEASSNLARYDGVRYGLRIDGKNAQEMIVRTRSEGFGKEVKERIIIGTYVLSAGYFEAFYGKAHKAKTLMKSQFREAFQEFDIIVGPTSPTVAFKIGEHSGDPMALKLADFCTIPANIGGFPALSLNAGFSEGLPVGFQLIANSFDEETLFSAALGLEEMLPKTPFPPIT